MKNTLGLEISKRLTARGIETPFSKGAQHSRPVENIKECIFGILSNLNLDLGDDSLKDTPHRVAKMYTQEVFYGLDYENFPVCTTVENKMGYDEMIATNCQVRSFCEHHLVPFIGTARVGYIPSTTILGLSKFNRVVDFFSRRPQIQERLTAQIHSALEYILETNDIAVVIKAKHYCVAVRGVQDETSETVTSQMGGKFFNVPALRTEFLALTR